MPETELLLCIFYQLQNCKQNQSNGAILCANSTKNKRKQVYWTFLTKVCSIPDCSFQYARTNTCLFAAVQKWLSYKTNSFHSKQVLSSRDVSKQSAFFLVSLLKSIFDRLSSQITQGQVSDIIAQTSFDFTKTRVNLAQKHSMKTTTPSTLYVSTSSESRSSEFPFVSIFSSALPSQHSTQQRTVCEQVAK